MSIRLVHSARAARIHLSAEQVARGARGGIVTGVTPSPAKIASKTPVTLVSRSRIGKRKEPVRPPGSMSRLRACWAVHPPSGRAVTPAPRPHLHGEQHARAPEEDRAGREEIAGEQATGRSAQERPPGGARVPRRRPAPPGARDPPHRRSADLVTGPAQFAGHFAVSPGRVLPRQPRHQGAELRAGAGPAWPVLAPP